MTKILLVEDDKSLREIYGVRLLAEGYDIVSAGDGEEALAMAIKERPNLIVSDVMMPKISGFDMLDILRSTTETKDIKVIMMTALSSEDQRARGEALGADRYLVKSQVGIEDVVRTVHEVLSDMPITGNRPAPQPLAPRPVAPVPPRPQSAVSPPTPQPVAPPINSAPISGAPPQPITLSGPVASAHTAPQTTSLPQPTAPFSTNRPASLGERVIHPIAQPASPQGNQDLGSLIDQELNKFAPPAPQASPITASTPTPQSISSIPGASQPVPPQTPTQQPASQPVAPPIPRQESGISFEEIPRPPAPPAPSA
jgi:CheY-like chemotaxis protein